jgi:hypothetical protein
VSRVLCRFNKKAGDIPPDGFNALEAGYTTKNTDPKIEAPHNIALDIPPPTPVKPKSYYKYTIPPLVSLESIETADR